MTMNKGFMLLAIRPQENCDKRFLKNLNKGTIYKLYNEYSYFNNIGDEIENSYVDINTVIEKKTSPSNLYDFSTSFENNLNINISALVGKNGSGKSTLLELLYVSCYVISSKAGIIRGTQSIVEEVKKKHNGWASVKEREELKTIEKIYSDLDVEIIYLKDGQLFILRLNKGSVVISLYENLINEFSFECNFEMVKKEDIIFFLSDFFYSISINYSQYGLNEVSLGLWARYLFHKNDGYQTPLVVNPYRDKGNINVNNELHLSQTRLLTNLILTNNKIKINDKTLESIVFNLNKQVNVNKYGDFLLTNHLTDLKFCERIYNEIYKKKIDEYLSLNPLLERPFLEVQGNYIFNKIVKIRDQYYKDFEIFKKEILDFNLLIKFLDKLSEDQSHITLKLRQTLNNIRFNILDDSKIAKWESKSPKYKINFINLFEKINNIKNNYKKFSYEELIPIACFVPTIFVKNDANEDKSVSELMALSSGEQHFVHTTQAILYHILNLESVHKGNKEKINYSSVNIVFDEIELYFHPEFQRIFIFELLKLLKSVPLFSIRNVNILFCTHSPFILSDILKQSILKLKNGLPAPYIEKIDENSFGANIYDLLKDDFYLSQGFIGEYATDKIVSLISHLDGVKNKDEDSRKIRNVYIWNEKNALEFINIIGEPLLKNTLREMYFKKYYNDEVIEREIERLKKLIKNDKY